MKAILGLTTAASLMFAASAASAATYDLIHAIDGSGIGAGVLGESYYSNADPLTTSDYPTEFAGPEVSFYAGYYDSNGNVVGAYVYADSGNAGLGVCRDINSRGITKGSGPQPGNIYNLCSPSGDDSIQNVAGADEFLQITFKESTFLTSFDVNANHDTALTDSSFIWVSLDGLNWDQISTDPVVGGTFTYDIGQMFSAGQSLFLKADCNQIYLSAMEASKVPVPATGLLLLGGLGGLAAMRRRRKAA